MDENGTKVTTTEAMTNGVANEPIYATDSEGNIIYETEVSEMTTTTKKKVCLVCGVKQLLPHGKKPAA